MNKGCMMSTWRAHFAFANLPFVGFGRPGTPQKELGTDAADGAALHIREDHTNDALKKK